MCSRAPPYIHLLPRGTSIMQVFTNKTYMIQSTMCSRFISLLPFLPLLASCHRPLSHSSLPHSRSPGSAPGSGTLFHTAAPGCPPGRPAAPLNHTTVSVQCPVHPTTPVTAECPVCVVKFSSYTTHESTTPWR